MKDRILELYSEFRRRLERCPSQNLPVSLHDFPRGACGDAAPLLAEFLSEHGYGPFRYILGERNGRSHAWLQGNGLIIDITADQFEDFDAPVFVGESSTWHESFDGRVCTKLIFGFTMITLHPTSLQPTAGSTRLPERSEHVAYHSDNSNAADSRKSGRSTLGPRRPSCSRPAPSHP